MARYKHYNYSQRVLIPVSLRGKIKVTVQWLLYCMVHNVEKIATCGLT